MAARGSRGRAVDLGAALRSARKVDLSCFPSQRLYGLAMVGSGFLGSWLKQEDPIDCSLGKRMELCKCRLPLGIPYGTLESSWNVACLGRDHRVVLSRKSPHEKVGRKCASPVWAEAGRFP